MQDRVLPYKGNFLKPEVGDLFSTMHHTAKRKPEFQAKAPKREKY